MRAPSSSFAFKCAVAFDQWLIAAAKHDRLPADLEGEVDKMTEYCGHVLRMCVCSLTAINSAFNIKRRFIDIFTALQCRVEVFNRASNLR